MEVFLSSTPDNLTAKIISKTKVRKEVLVSAAHRIIVKIHR